MTEVLRHERANGVSVKRLEAGSELPVESESIFVSHRVVVDDVARVVRWGEGSYSAVVGLGEEAIGDGFEGAMDGG